MREGSCGAFGTACEVRRQGGLGQQAARSQRAVPRDRRLSSQRSPQGPTAAVYNLQGGSAPSGASQPAVGPHLRAGTRLGTRPGTRPPSTAFLAARCCRFCCRASTMVLLISRTVYRGWGMRGGELAVGATGWGCDLEVQVVGPLFGRRCRLQPHFCSAEQARGVSERKCASGPSSHVNVCCEHPAPALDTLPQAVRPLRNPSMLALNVCPSPTALRRRTCSRPISAILFLFSSILRCRSTSQFVILLCFRCLRPAAAEGSRLNKKWEEVLG